MNKNDEVYLKRHPETKGIVQNTIGTHPYEPDWVYVVWPNGNGAWYPASDLETVK